MPTREKRAEYNARYRLKNIEKIRAAARLYFLSNKEKIKNRHIKMREIYSENRKNKYRNDAFYRQRCIDRVRLRAVNKKDAVNAYKNSWLKEKSKTDDLLRLKIIIRRRIWAAMKRKGWTRKSSALNLLGAQWETVKIWIQSKFNTGMSWENHGDWHIDHVIPLSSAKTEAELIALFNYRNIQPLWAFDNLSKGAKL